MARITQLPLAGPLNGAEMLPIVQAGQTRRVGLAALIGPNGEAIIAALALAPRPDQVDYYLAGAGNVTATAMFRAFAYTQGAGLPDPAFRSASYTLAPLAQAERAYPVPGFGTFQPCFSIPPGTRVVDFGGATFNAAPGSYAVVFGFFFSVPVGKENDPEVYGSVLSGDLAAGEDDFPLVAGQGARWAAGDTGVWKLGELPFDYPETLNWGIAKVVSVAGDVVKLDKPNLAPFVLASVTYAGIASYSPPCKVLRKVPVLRDCVVRNGTIAYTPGNGGHALDIVGAERVRFERLGAINPKNGFVFQYCDGLTISDVWQDGMTVNVQDSGTFMRFAECRNVIVERPRATGVLMFMGCEAGAEIVVRSPKFENTALDNAGLPRIGILAFNSVAHSKIAVENLTITGYGGYVLSNTSNGVAGWNGTISFTGTTRLIHPTEPTSIDLWTIDGILDTTIAGVREVWDFLNTRTIKRRVNLKNGMYNYIPLAAKGPLKRLRVYCSPGLAGKIGAGGPLNNFYVSKVGGAGALDLIYSFGTAQAGKLVEYACRGGNSPFWTERALENNLIISTTSGTDLEATNEFVEVELEIASFKGVDELGSTGITVSEANWRGLGDDAEDYEAAFLAYDLAAIAAGAILQIDFPIPDMAAGDLVTSVSFVSGLAGLSIRSAEAIAGQCRVVFENQTGAAIDTAATDVRVRFVKPQAGL